ncbi:hypothetical protein AVEN_182186-1 [Araneus ventricosus]|uniref:Uncharacterized protein n=1 Tax=Araneus ventricosus TaxID=182803 RepID=A0A4Y2E423_ARAVE|nr:hypothetical protein AVEN_182186-1 [Araneus ventricosus]
MENDALFTNIQERRNTGNRNNTALAQITTQADSKLLIIKVIARTIALSVSSWPTRNANKTPKRFQRHSYSKDDRSRSTHVPIYPYCRVFIVFLTGRDVTWKSLEKSGSQLL